MMTVVFTVSSSLIIRTSKVMIFGDDVHEPQFSNFLNVKCWLLLLSRVSCYVATLLVSSIFLLKLVQGTKSLHNRRVRVVVSAVQRVHCQRTKVF